MTVVLQRVETPAERRAPAGDISLGDAISAMVRLDADPAVSARLALLLGFELRPPRPSSPLPSHGGPSHTAYTPEALRPRVRQRTGAASGAAIDAPRLGDRATDVTPWRRHLQPVGRELAAGAGHHVQPLPPDPVTRPQLRLLPLLLPRYTPRIVQIAASTDARDGDLDLDKSVELLARRRPVARWPRLSRMTMLSGVQLLVDVGESMTPFGRDADALADAFRSTVGPHLVEELNFAGSPWAGVGTGGPWDWTRYRPPPPGTPVVALSDLDLPGREGHGPDVSGWTRLRNTLAQRDSRLIVFTPFPVARYQGPIAAHVCLVRWDRLTTPSSLLRATGGGKR